MGLSPASVWGLLATYLRPQWRRSTLLGILLVGSAGLQVANPQVIRQFIDLATASTGSPESLAGTALLFIGIALVQQALAVGATYVGQLVGWTATNALRADLTRHCLQIDLSYHKTKTPGELIERIDGDVTQLATFFSEFAVRIVGNLLLLVGVLVVMWLTDWRAGLVLSLYAALVLGTLGRLHAVAIPQWRAARQASADLFGFIEERLAGTVDLRTSGATAYVMRRLFERTRARYAVGRRARLFGSIPWSVNLFYFSVGYSLAFVLAAYLYGLGSITLGTAFLVYFYTVLMFQPLNVITHQVEDFQKAGASIIRIQDLLAIRGLLADGPGATFPPAPLSVEFDDVSFGYGDDEPVLRDLTFRLAPGTVLGLLGRTGSGKTTISRLLFRLYDVEAGQIRLGGVDIRQAKLEDLRRRIGLVTQDVQLFNATVRDNLTFFDRSIDDKRILAALADLGLEEWCRSLSRGLDTVLGAGGAGVSAGEAQLLAFTRVFLKQPGVVILDEASSRLDPATERLVDHAVDRLLQGRTGIIIAHRLSTIRRADSILILEDGEVAEHGAREALAADPSSRLAALLRAGAQEVLV
jgi:ABC-type multidrug transport system fused ATPase/permease subunit